MFSKLLMLDIESHEYAYWLDPNSVLSFDMFSTSTGSISRSGFIEVFKALQIFVKEIDCMSQEAVIPESEQKSTPRKPISCVDNSNADSKSESEISPSQRPFFRQ